MLLKNHLIEVFTKASSDNNTLLKENIVLKWVHRFGIESLNDLLIHSSIQKENQHEEENQEQISLIDEVNKENQEQISLIDEVNEENQEQISLVDEVNKGNQEQINLGLTKTSENIEEIKCESNGLETASSNGIFCKDQNLKNIKQLSDNQKLPLPNIKNLRKWINNDKKAS